MFMAVPYKAPVKDIVFGYEVIDSYNVLNKISAFSDFSEDVVIPTMEECAKFSEEILAPINAIGDQQGATIKDGVVTMPEEFVDAYKKFSEAGWASISLPSDIGGGGMPITLSGGTLEILGTANLAFGLAPGLSAGAISAINFHGNQEQKDKFLPKLVSGEWTGTMNLSEPQSGSDLGTITTKAEPQEDGSYKITGTKVWITFGEHNMTENIIHLVLAKVPGSPEGTKGISMFIVPKYMVNDDGSVTAKDLVSAVPLQLPVTSGTPKATTSIELGVNVSATSDVITDDPQFASGYVFNPNDPTTYPYDIANPSNNWTLNTNEKGILLEDYTGHKCTNCPAAATIATQLEDDTSLGVIVVSVHASTDGSFQSTDDVEFTVDYQTEAGDAYVQEMPGFIGNPMGTINRNDGGYSNTNWYFSSNWATGVNDEISQDNLDANVQLQYHYYPSTNGLFIHTETTFLNTLSGNYHLIVYLIRNDVVSPQKMNDGTIDQSNDEWFMPLRNLSKNKKSYS